MFNLQGYVKRKAEDDVRDYLKIFPAVTILGPRQCGKSTLVKMLSDSIESFVYLDLQNIDDLNKLSEPSLFFQTNPDATICLDEIQFVPELFSVLRSAIDKNRKPGRFILLGSASRDLVQKTSESLAGRVGFIELTPFTIQEIIDNEGFTIGSFWNRGGFPDSYLADNDKASSLWRENFIRTFVERDIPQLGINIPSLQIRRLLMMCSHLQGQLFNASKIGESLGITHTTVRRHLDILEQTFIIRTLMPYGGNLKKRLVKSPKVYIRDSGLLHRLLLIADFNTLMGHPIFGSSWEGFVIENIIASLHDCDFSFYRSSTGDELDLIIQMGNKTIAVECKASTAPQVTKGFWNAIKDVNPDKTYIIAPITGSYPYKDGVDVCGLKEFLENNFIVSAL